MSNSLDDLLDYSCYSINVEKGTESQPAVACWFLCGKELMHDANQTNGALSPPRLSEPGASRAEVLC